MKDNSSRYFSFKTYQNSIISKQNAEQTFQISKKKLKKNGIYYLHNGPNKYGIKEHQLLYIYIHLIMLRNECIIFQENPPKQIRCTGGKVTLTNIYSFPTEKKRNTLVCINNGHSQAIHASKIIIKMFSFGFPL